MTPPPVSAAILNARLKQDEQQYPEPSRIRLHRAISWLARAEYEAADLDAQFIFLWVAFNAAYAREMEDGKAECERLRRFIDALIEVDLGHRLHTLVFEQFTGPIRTLIENRFVFAPFWEALRTLDSSGRWERRFARSRKAALASVMNGETAKVLSIVFDRLYVLRNQLVHGGATWNSGLNRTQVRDGAHIMQAIVPTLIELMLDNPQVDFGAILYPVV